MSHSRASNAFYVTTAIPYVNAAPHIGFAMELVLADVTARYQRLRGRDVRFQTGTDENSLKNVQAAQAEGISTERLVERNAGAFLSLRESLALSFDDFIRTSTDSRHRSGVERLWRACAASGDIYKRPYRGLYCVGCEQFYAEADLVDGRCPEHATVPDVVEEDNYFFRLSRYQNQVLDLLESNELDVAPEHFRNEVLAFVRAGLQDFSISRSRARAHGWGVPVPDDPEQVMYVWFDALGNYITALDYVGSGEPYRRYWQESADRVHFIGKGITRFHAIYWPAMLLSAGVPLPTAVAVHGYLTVGGKKIGKSLGNAIDPTALVADLGVDVLRYFLCRHIRSGQDGDFDASRVAQVRNAELADQLGNLLNRTVNMIDRYYDGRIPPAVDESALREHVARVRGQFQAGLEAFRHDDALRAVWSLVETANKLVVERAPWKLAKRRTEPGVEPALAGTLYALAEILRLVATFLEPFIPGTAVAIRVQLGISPEIDWDRATTWGGLEPGTRVQSGEPLFPKPAAPDV